MTDRPSLASVLASMPERRDKRSIGYRLEELGMVDEVLAARRGGASFERIAKALNELGVKITPNPVKDFCRANGVD